MSVRVRLACIRCGETAEVRPYFLLSKWGTLRVQGSLPDGWSVRGDGARCPAHNDRVEKINDTWTEYDREAAQTELDRQEAHCAWREAEPV